MIYKPYGRTGKSISAIAAGGMRWSAPSDIERHAEVLRYAHSQGINYFDTAPGYCEDHSEAIVGAAIRDMEPGSYYVSTKCGADEGAQVRASLERSRERLGLEQIHFFHIWCVLNQEKWAIRKAAGAVEAALQAKSDGLVEHVVVSTHMSGTETEAMLQEGYFEGVTLGYNAINFPFRETGVAAAGRLGLGVVAMNPLGGGVIPQQAERFNFIRQPHDADVVTAALRFVVAHPCITSALVGFSDSTQVDAAVQAMNNFDPATYGNRAALEAHITSRFDGLCTGCGYCLPCPVGVPIPKLMDAHNQGLLEGSSSATLNRLKWHWGLPASTAAACTACGACEEACTQHLPIIERLAEVAALQE